MPSLRHILVTVIMLVVLVSGGISSVASTVEGDVPDDLLLTPEETDLSQALSYFAWGLFLHMEGKSDFDRVAEQYVKALELAPDSTFLLEYLVSPYFVARKFDKLEELLRPFTETHPDQLHAQLVLAEVLQAQKKHVEASESLLRALDACDWEEPVLLRELFVSLWREKRYGEIQSVLRKARLRKTLRTHFVVEHAAALFYHALASTGEADAEDGNGAGKEAVGLDLPPRKTLAKRARKHALRAARLVHQAERATDLETLANVLMASGMKDETIQMLHDAVSLDRFAGDPGLFLLLSKALAEGGKKGDAIRVLESVTDKEELPPALYEDVAQIYERAGDPEHAAQFLERALISFPRALHVRLQLAYLYLQMGAPKKGLATLAPVQKLPPRGHLFVAHLYRRLEDNARALKALEEAVKDPAQAEKENLFTVDFYLFFATVAEDAGETDLALEQAGKALALEPEDPVGANFVGYVLADHNRELDRAEKLIQQALAAEPESVAYLDSIAWVYYRQGRYAEAMREIGHALRAGESAAPDPVILDHAGDIYESNGFLLLAGHYWSQALARGALRPDAIREKLSRIKATLSN